jgi:hypothetical protein
MAKLSEDQCRQIRHVASFSQGYISTHLGQWDPERLRSDWWTALQFFFSHSFYQGRRDSLSLRFERAATEALSESLDPSSNSERLHSVCLDEGSTLDADLQNAGLTKRMDRLMVLSTLAFIRELPQANIVAWSLDEIEQGAVYTVYRELDSIKSVGDKIISFFLRDLDFLFNLAPQLDGDEVLMQPVDTWVRQISESIGIVQPGDSDHHMKRSIVIACNEADVSPNRYNVGAWCVGARVEFPLAPSDK